MDPHRLLAAVKRRWPDDHGPEFVKQQIASILLEDAAAVDQGYQVGLPSLGLKLRARLGTEWKEQHGLQHNTTLRKLLEKEGCFEIIMLPNSNVANAVKLNVAAMLQDSSARTWAAPQRGAAPRSPAAAFPASNGSITNSPQASAAAGSSSRSAGTALSGNVKVVPRPLAAKGSPKAAPASANSPAAGSHSSYSSNGLPNLPDTLDSPPPMKPTRVAPKALSSAAALNGVGGSRAVPNGSSAVAAAASSSGAVASSSGSTAAATAKGGAAAGASSQGSVHAAGTAEVAACAKSAQWRELESYVWSLQLHEKPQANRLLQCLVVYMLHRAVAAADGNVSKAFNVSVSAAEAGKALQNAWQRLYSGQRFPFASLPELLAGQQQQEQQRELLRHVHGKDGERVLLLTAALKKQFMRASPASSEASSSSSPACGGSAASNPHSRPVAQAGAAAPKKAGAARAPASPSGAAAGGVGMSTGVAAGVDFLKRATAAAAAERAGARTHTSPNPAAAAAAAAPGAGSSRAASAAAANLSSDSVIPISSAAAGGTGGAIARVPKQLLLGFIQTWQFDRNVDWCHMKRALATKLVNGAADGSGMVALDLRRTRLHVAQAGLVFQQVWRNRHPNAGKTHHKMGAVLAGDAFLSLRDGPQHSNQLVQLDIISLAAAAEAAAAAEPAGGTAAGDTAGYAAFAGGESSSSNSRTTAANGGYMRGGVHSLQEVESAAAAAAADTAAQAVALRVAQSALLAVDLLGFAGMITWHDANEGLGLLRQQLACTMIKAAHPGLAEAAAAGQPVLAEQDEARYFMSPYDATSAMLACWSQHYPGVPKPYSTLPEAFDGCRYLHLLPGASWKLQLDIQQMIADCAATMRDMQGDWEAMAAAGAAAVAARAPSLLAEVDAATPAAAAAGASQNELLVGSDSGVPNNGFDHYAVGGVNRDVTAPMPAAAPAAGSTPGQNDNDAASLASCNSSSSSSPSAVAPTALQQGQQQLLPTVQQQQHQQQQQQLAVPNVTQLLELLAYAPPDICSRASVLLVPEVAQTLMFANQGDSLLTMQQLQQLAGSAAASAYAAQGIQVVSDAAAASQVCDHLMACPILAFGMCCSSSGSNSSSSTTRAKEVPVLLQVLAPPIFSGGAALDAAVYVFDVRGQPQQQQQSAALLTLLNILLEDVRVVKLVEDAAHVASVVSRHFHISCQGLLDVAALQELLAPAGLLEDEQAAGDGVSQGLCGHIAAVKQASWKLLSSNRTLRALAGRSTQQQQQQQQLPSAELVSAAASAVRPLVSLTENAVQLLPLALMRRCLQGTG